MRDEEIDALWKSEQLSVPQIVRRRAIARAAIFADRRAAQPADEWLREAERLMLTISMTSIAYARAISDEAVTREQKAMANAHFALSAHLEKRVAQAWRNERA